MNDREFSELWTNLVHRNSGSATPPLTSDERHFYAVNLLRGSVLRSGFIGYFENVTDREINDAYKGLKELSLDSVSLLLQQAQELALADRPIPTDGLPIQVFPDSLDEKEYDELCERLDTAMKPVEEKMYSLDDEMWQALGRFAEQRKLKPRG